MAKQGAKKGIFTKSELQEVRAAVKEAEDRTHGEFVPVFVKESDFYEEALWRAGFVSAFIAGSLLIILDSATEWLLWIPCSFWLIIVLAFGVGGAFLTMNIDTLRRVFAGMRTLEERAHKKAQLMFFDLDVFNTKQRIGIMIFISFFERQVIVLADEGINAVIPQEEWEGVVKKITNELKENQKVKAILAGIAACTKLVEESPIEILEDEENEIPDDLRTDE